MKRRKPDSMEVQQMKAQAKEEKARYSSESFYCFKNFSSIIYVVNLIFIVGVLANVTN